MIVHYLDPSVWAKRYFYEAGSEAVAELFRTVKLVACCRLGLVEIMAAIARKSRAEALEVSLAQQIIRDVNADFIEFDVIAIEESLVQNATNLAMKYGLRPMDAIHLAAALSRCKDSDTVVLVSSDIELLTAAGKEGLTVIDPAKG